MALFDKIGDFAKAASEKANNLVDTGKLNSKISTEERGISAIVTKIGEYYLAKLDSGEVLDDDVMNMYEGIKSGRASIAAAKEEIAAINAPEPTYDQPAPEPEPVAEPAPEPAAPIGQKFCPMCGAALAPDAKFCPLCGAKLE